MPRVLTGAEDLYVSKNGNSPVVRVTDIQNWTFNQPIGPLSEFFSGKPTASQVVYGYIAPNFMRLPKNLPLSQIKVTVAATASTVLTINKNGSSIGSATIAASGTSATFTFANDVTFVAGDVLSIVAPGSADATAANFIFMLVPQLA